MRPLDWAAAVVGGVLLCTVTVLAVDFWSQPPPLRERAAVVYPIALHVVDARGYRVCLATTHDDPRRGLLWAERIVQRLNDEAGKTVATAHPGRGCK